MISHYRKDQEFTTTIFTGSFTPQKVRNREFQDAKTFVKIMVITQIYRLISSNSSVNQFRLGKIAMRETMQESKSQKRNKGGQRRDRKKRMLATLTHNILVNQWASSKICRSQNQEVKLTHYLQHVVLEALWWTSQKIRKQSDWMLLILRLLLLTLIILTAMHMNQTRSVNSANWILRLSRPKTFRLNSLSQRKKPLWSTKNWKG